MALSYLKTVSLISLAKTSHIIQLIFFEISADDFILAEERGAIVALVHSHPDSAFEKGLPYLSIADRECQVRTQLDFLAGGG